MRHPVTDEHAAATHTQNSKTAQVPIDPAGSLCQTVEPQRLPHAAAIDLSGYQMASRLWSVHPERH